MFCCDDKKRKDDICYKGIIIGGIVAAASIMVIGICKKIKCRKIEKMIHELKMEEINTETPKQENQEKSQSDEEIELKEKVEKFNSRRLTTENESKNNED